MSQFNSHSSGQAITSADINAIQTALDQAWINVKSPLYGALGDNSTDDTAAIQAALDDLDAAGGGTIYFPSGIYITETLTWYSNIRGLGDGLINSILKLKNGTDGNLITGENFSSLTGGNDVDGIHDFGLRDLSLDGNKANNASGWCIQFYGYRPEFRDVDIRNGKSGGMYSQGFDATDPVNTFSVDGSFIRTSFHHSDGTGLFYNGIHDATFTDCWFFYNTRGLDIGARGDGVKFEQCHIYGNDQDYCMVTAASANKFTSCTFEGADTSNVLLNTGCTGAQFVGCHFYAAGTQTTKVGIEVDGASTYLIASCFFENLTDGAILFTDDDGSAYITGNYVFATSGDAFAGTANSSTSFKNNEILGGAGGGTGSIVTIASGQATMPNGCTFIFVNGEGAAADVLDNLSIQRVGHEVAILANHEITFNHTAGGSGQILCPGGTDYVLAQFGVVKLISANPNWVLIEG